MKTRIRGHSALMVIAMVVATMLVTGCGGGKGGGPGAGSAGQLLSVSFVGFPTQPSTGPVGGALPAVFRDEVIEFTFDGSIDLGIFGGFISDPGGNPIEFRGLAPNAAGEIIYHAYVFQSAARNSLEIRENNAGGPLLSSYVVGRHRDKPDTLIIDPRVSGSNSFGLPSNPGFLESTEYTYRIPVGTGITIGGSPVQPVGVLPTLLPITTPVFSPQPNLSLIFLAGIAFSPDPIPPEVLSISTLSGAAGTSTDPIPVADGFEIVFSKLVDNASVDQLRNFRVVNNDILTQGATGEPSQVPGAYTFAEVDNRTVVTFVPTPGFGPGLGTPPTLGYTIAVRVGSFQNPSIPPITGQPQGNPPASLPLSNSLQALFVTQPTPGAPGSATYIELFDNQDQYELNPDYSLPDYPDFNEATWAAAPSDPCSNLVIPPPSPGGQPTSFLPPVTQARLMASRVCGNPLATTGNGGNPLFLGTRTQFDLTQTIFTTLFPPSTLGLVAPFDDANANQGAGSNPDGGDHLMQIYESRDIGHNFGTPSVPLQDSLELVEWGPVNDIVNASCYPSYQCWVGMTTNCAPACAQNPCTNPNPPNIPTGACQGLSFNYASNYDVQTVQAPDPLGLGGVLVSPVGAYVVATQFAHYMAFPTNNPTFDFNPGDAPSGNANFVIEQNIEPGSGQAPPPPSPPNPATCNAVFNVNRFNAGANFPVRRAFGPPLSIQLQTVGNPTLISANFGGWDRYDWRFTWVNSRSQAQSKFYFQETIEDPTYESVTIIPSPLDQPVGTSSKWEFQGTDAITLAGQPFGAFTPWLTYWEGPARDPLNAAAPTGQFFPAILQQLDGFKYIRFRVTMRANHLKDLGNGSFGTFQNYTGVIFNVAF